MQHLFEPLFSGWPRLAVALALAGSATACQSPQPRLEQLEAVQQQQARELTQLKQALAARDEEVAQLESCVNELENAVYEADSAAEDDEKPQLTQL